MGEDNIINLHKWKNYSFIIENYHIYVYPRPNTKKSENHTLPKVTIVDNIPKMEISSSFIRKSIKQGKDVRYLLHHKVYDYICDMHFYEK